MKKPIFIYGMGRNGNELLSQLNNRKVEISAFIDNDKNKQKKKDIYPECISIDEAIKRGARDSIILVSLNEGDKIEKELKEQQFKYVYCVSKWIRKNKYFNPSCLELSDYIPFNHYESPYPDIIKVHNFEEKLFDKNKKVLDINFNMHRQIELFKMMENIKLLPWEEDRNCNLQYRYYYNNGWFARGSADALYFMIRILNPKNIIEVGSGYSTAVMLDTNENYFDNKISITCIEPNPKRLISLLKSTDNIEIYERELQEIPLDIFNKLKENDILFIDSSHISKFNSDVNYLFFEILPRLHRGVYIHFHDIFYPFIYPKEWIYEGRAYNEMYILRAFLMNNKNYSIQLFGDMPEAMYPDKIPEQLLGCGGGSLWIRKEV